MRTLPVACGLSLLAAPLAGQAPQLSDLTRRFVTVDSAVVALTHARIVDGTGAAPAEDQTIVIRSGTIAAVGPARTVAVPPGAQVLDLHGHTVLPGFVGLHDHTFYKTSARSIQISTSAPPPTSAVSAS